MAIDLQPMSPIEGVIQVQGDITNARTAQLVNFSILSYIMLQLHFVFVTIAYPLSLFVCVCVSFLKRLSDTLLVARQTWLFVMVLQMVKHHISSYFRTICFIKIYLVFRNLVYVVTGLHDMDEFVQSQLILAVKFSNFLNHVFHL